MVHFYLSGPNGNDGNNGLTAAQAVHSMGKLMSLVEAVDDQQPEPIFAHIGVHSGTGYDAIRVRPRDLHANLWFIGDGAGQSGEDGFTVLKATATAGGGSSTTVLASAEAMTVGAHNGKTVIFYNASAVEVDRRTIRNNDANNVFPVRPFTSSPAGLQWRIVEAADVVSLATDNTLGDPILCEGTGYGQSSNSGFRWSVYFVNLGFTSTASVRACIKSSNATFFGVEFRGAGLITMSWSASTVNAGIDNVDTVGSVAQGPVFDGLVTSNTAWLGWGANSVGNANNYWGAGNNCASNCYYVGPGISAGFGSTVRVRGGKFVHTTSPCLTAAAVGEIQCIADSSSLPILADNAASVGTVRTSVAGGKVVLSNVTANNTAGPVLNADFGGTIEINGTTTGNGSTSGTQARHGGRVFVNNGAPAVTGTVGDISVDDGATHSTNATLSANNTSVVNAVTQSMVLRTA